MVFPPTLRKTTLRIFCVTKNIDNYDANVGGFLNRDKNPKLC